MDPEQSKPFTPQMVSRFKDAIVVNLVDFPIYYIECISERHFVVAGGGGSAKTGVHNQINILELVPTTEACTTNLVTKYHTPKEIPDAIMAGSLMRHLPISDTRLVTGGLCATIYTVNFDTKQMNFKISDFEILDDERLDQDIKTVKCVPDRILAGSMTGQLTLWSFSDQTKVVDKIIKAHSKPIDDIDVDLHNQQIVTLSRDEGRCAIWSLPDLTAVAEFKKDFINSQTAKFAFRSARYASKSQETCLIVACNPIPSKGPSKLIKLMPKDFKKFDTVSVGIEGIMAMTVSLDGGFVGLGSRDGSVCVFDVKNLKQIYSISQAHHNAVTSLHFLDPKPESLHLTNSNCCALLSASIDRRVILHPIKKGSLFWTLGKILLSALILYIIFFALLFKNNK